MTGSDEPDALSQQFGRDFVQLVESGRMMPLELNAAEAFYLVSALQLALRHPLFPLTIRPSVERIAHSLEAKLSVTPAIAEILRRGWHTEYDEE